MRTAIIIHGMPSKEEDYGSRFDSPSNSHWIPWIQKQLLIRDIFTQTPEMPTPYLPDYEAWKRELERFDINENTILVGHSCGAGFIIRYLSENNIKVNKVALVAPWINPENDTDGEKMFKDLYIDKNILDKVFDLKVFISRDDEEWMIDSIKKIEEEVLNIEEKIVWFEDKGHFTLTSMGAREFPELLEFLIS